jgi:hypothetical protein
VTRSIYSSFICCICLKKKCVQVRSHAKLACTGASSEMEESMKDEGNAVAYDSRERRSMSGWYVFRGHHNTLHWRGVGEFRLREGLAVQCRGNHSVKER